MGRFPSFGSLFHRGRSPRAKKTRVHPTVIHSSPGPERMSPEPLSRLAMSQPACATPSPPPPLPRLMNSRDYQDEYGEAVPEMEEDEDGRRPTLSMLVGKSEVPRGYEMTSPHSGRSTSSRNGLLSTLQENRRLRRNSFNISPRRPELKKRKCNSCGTIHIDSTLAEPNVHLTVECVSVVLLQLLRKARNDPAVMAEKKKKKNASSISDIFEDSRVTKVATNLEAIKSFILHIYSRAELHVECILTSLILIQRLLKKHPELGPTNANWRPLVFTQLMLASKLCDDETPKNADWHNVCVEYPLHRINAFEVAILQALDFEVAVTASQYAQTYFDLRSIASRRGMDASSRGLRPLDVKLAKHIAKNSRRFMAAVSPATNHRSIRRTRSFREKDRGDKATGKSPTATIEQLVDMSPMVKTYNISWSGEAEAREAFRRSFSESSGVNDDQLPTPSLPPRLFQSPENPVYNRHPHPSNMFQSHEEDTPDFNARVTADAIVKKNSGPSIKEPSPFSLPLLKEAGKQPNTIITLLP